MNQLRRCAHALGVLLLAGGLAGCAATGGHGHATGRVVGQVTGELLMEGGAIGPGGQQPGPCPIPGTVSFTAAGHQLVAVGVGPSGTFSVQLPPGRYDASGRSPFIAQVRDGSKLQLPCSQPVPVTVSARQTAIITVTCIVP
jgi:hypothetical protein